MPKFSYEEHKKKMRAIMNKQPATPQDGKPRVPKFVPRKRI